MSSERRLSSSRQSPPLTSRSRSLRELQGDDGSPNIMVVVQPEADAPRQGPPSVHRMGSSSFHRPGGSSPRGGTLAGDEVSPASGLGMGLGLRGGLYEEDVLPHHGHDRSDSPPAMHMHDDELMLGLHGAAEDADAYPHGEGYDGHEDILEGQDGLGLLGPLMDGEGEGDGAAAGEEGGEAGRNVGAAAFGNGIAPGGGGGPGKAGKRAAKKKSEWDWALDWGPASACTVQQLEVLAACACMHPWCGLVLWLMSVGVQMKQPELSAAVGLEKAGRPGQSGQDSYLA